MPERLNAINRGYRTLHFYNVAYDPHDPDRIAGGTQDNGSWETLGDRETWVNVNVADGGHNGFDAPGGDPEYQLTGWQGGQIEIKYNPLDQYDVNWSADTLFVFYGNEAVRLHRRRDDRPGDAGLDLDRPRARVPLDQLGPQPAS